MAQFLSEEWFSDLNVALAMIARPDGDESTSYSVAIELADAPSALPHALSVRVSSVISVVPGDDLAAEAMLRLPYDVALALTEGTIDSGQVLREGKLKVRGNIAHIVASLGWLTLAHSTLSPQDKNESSGS